MNGVESIHITVFPILNTPGVICSTAETETETGQRIHFQQWNVGFFFSEYCFTPLLLSIIYFQLNGGWRIPPFAQWNILKALLERQLKGHVYFPHLFFLLFDLLIGDLSTLWLCIDSPVQAICSVKHKSSHTDASVVPLWVSHTVMIYQPLSVRIVLRNSHICAAGNKERIIMTHALFVAQIQGL